MELEAGSGLSGASGAAAHWRKLRSFLPRRPNADPKIAELLRIPLFAALPQDRLELLVRTAYVAEVPAGVELIREGTVGREFFAISKGTVEVSEGGRPVAVERAGDFFGEIALLQRILRTATVKTTSPTRVFVMTPRAFRTVLEPSFE